MGAHSGVCWPRVVVLLVGAICALQLTLGQVAVAATLPGAASAAPLGDPSTVPDRPWRIRSIAPGAPCPVTLRSAQPSRDLGVMFGAGPARPIGIDEDGVLKYARAHRPGSIFVDSEWGGAKVLWAVAPKVRTVVRVRGRQLDGPGAVRFGSEIEPTTELVLSAPESNGQRLDGGWRDFPSLTRIQNPGCYAYQIDTPTKSKVIVFEARDTL